MAGKVVTARQTQTAAEGSVFTRTLITFYARITCIFFLKTAADSTI